MCENCQLLEAKALRQALAEDQRHAEALEFENHVPWLPVAVLAKMDVKRNVYLRPNTSKYWYWQNARAKPFGSWEIQFIVVPKRTNTWRGLQYGYQISSRRTLNQLLQMSRWRFCFVHYIMLSRFVWVCAAVCLRWPRRFCWKWRKSKQLCPFAPQKWLWHVQRPGRVQCWKLDVGFCSDKFLCQYVSISAHHRWILMLVMDFPMDFPDYKSQDSQN